MQPNLLFFMTDQQRVDSIGKVVHDVPVAPNWYALAKESCHFLTAYNTCPLCVPSRTALATGKDPLNNGVMLNDLEGKYATKETPLHKLLHDAGYEVAHIGVNHLNLDPKLSDQLPFAHWIDDDSYECYARSKGISLERSAEQTTTVKEYQDGEYKNKAYSNTKVAQWEHSTEDFKDVWFTDQACEYIRQEHDKPFALFVCLWAPHPPLTVPPEYLEKFPTEKIGLDETIGLPSQNEPPTRRLGVAAGLGRELTQESQRETIAAHYALTHLADEQLGRIRQTLIDCEMQDKTIIVATCDHGEHLGQHGMYQKMEMYEDAVRVPAIFHVPTAQARTYNVAITHLDFVPTILSLLNIPTSINFDGIDLSPSILKHANPPERSIFGLYSGNHHYGDMRRMIVKDQYKYVWDGTYGELFDLIADPKEQINIADKQAIQAIKQQLHQELAAWGIARGDLLNYYDGEQIQ